MKDELKKTSPVFAMDLVKDSDSGERLFSPFSEDIMLREAVVGSDIVVSEVSIHRTE